MVQTKKKTKEFVEKIQKLKKGEIITAKKAIERAGKQPQTNQSVAVKVKRFK